jgi:hypothetical protein
MLLSLGSRYPLSVAEVDITSDEALLWSYGEAIPVIVVDGRSPWRDALLRSTWRSG